MVKGVVVVMMVLVSSVVVSICVVVGRIDVVPGAVVGGVVGLVPGRVDVTKEVSVVGGEGVGSVVVMKVDVVGPEVGVIYRLVVPEVVGGVLVVGVDMVVVVVVVVVTVVETVVVGAAVVLLDRVTNM